MGSSVSSCQSRQQSKPKAQAQAQVKSTSSQAQPQTRSTSSKPQPKVQPQPQTKKIANIKTSSFEFKSLTHNKLYAKRTLKANVNLSNIAEENLSTENSPVNTNRYRNIPIVKC